MCTANSITETDDNNAVDATELLIEDKVTPIHTIVTHFEPHAEEFGGYYLLKTQPEAEEKYPGISKAKLEFWGLGSRTPDGKSAATWKQNGYYLLGVGGGDSDEHAANGRDRKQGASALSLVAEDLGLEHEPWLNRIVEILTQEDLHAGSGELSLMSLAKLMNLEHPDEPEIAMDWVIQGLGVKMRQQQHFHAGTRAEFLAKAQTQLLRVTDQKDPRKIATINLVTIESDDDLIANFAICKLGGGAEMVAVRKSTGNVIIMTRKSRRIYLGDIIRVLRIREMELAEIENPLSWRMLETTEGTVNVKGANRWCYFLEGRMIMNGSRTARDVEPTQLSLREIINIIKFCLDPEAFATDRPERTKHCLTRVCTSGNQKTCPWHDAGLNRCRKIRFEMHEWDEASRWSRYYVSEAPRR